MPTQYVPNPEQSGYSEINKELVETGINLSKKTHKIYNSLDADQNVKYGTEPFKYSDVVLFSTKDVNFTATSPSMLEKEFISQVKRLPGCKYNVIRFNREKNIRAFEFMLTYSQMSQWGADNSQPTPMTKQFKGSFVFTGCSNIKDIETIERYSLKMSYRCETIGDAVGKNSSFVGKENAKGGPSIKFAFTYDADYVYLYVVDISPLRIIPVGNGKYLDISHVSNSNTFIGEDKGTSVDAFSDTINGTKEIKTFQSNHIIYCDLNMSIKDVTMDTRGEGNEIEFIDFDTAFPRIAQVLSNEKEFDFVQTNNGEVNVGNMLPASTKNIEIVTENNTINFGGRLRSKDMASVLATIKDVEAEIVRKASIIGTVPFTINTVIKTKGKYNVKLDKFTDDRADDFGKILISEVGTYDSVNDKFKVLEYVFDKDQILKTMSDNISGYCSYIKDASDYLQEITKPHGDETSYVNERSEILHLVRQFDFDDPGLLEMYSKTAYINPVDKFEVINAFVIVGEDNSTNSDDKIAYFCKDNKIRVAAFNDTFMSNMLVLDPFKDKHIQSTIVDCVDNVRTGEREYIIGTDVGLLGICKHIDDLETFTCEMKGAFVNDTIHTSERVVYMKAELGYVIIGGSKGSTAIYDTNKGTYDYCTKFFDEPIVYAGVVYESSVRKDDNFVFTAAEIHYDKPTDVIVFVSKTRICSYNINKKEWNSPKDKYHLSANFINPFTDINGNIDYNFCNGGLVDYDLKHTVPVIQVGQYAYAIGVRCDNAKRFANICAKLNVNNGEVTSLPLPDKLTIGAKLVADERYIYVIGGRPAEVVPDEPNSRITYLSIYDTARDEWVKLKTYVDPQMLDGYKDDFEKRKTELADTLTAARQEAERVFASDKIKAGLENTPERIDARKADAIESLRDKQAQLVSQCYVTKIGYRYVEDDSPAGYHSESYTYVEYDSNKAHEIEVEYAKLIEEAESADYDTTQQLIDEAEKKMQNTIFAAQVEYSDNLKEATDTYNELVREWNESRTTTRQILLIDSSVSDFDNTRFIELDEFHPYVLNHIIYIFNPTVRYSKLNSYDKFDERTRKIYGIVALSNEFVVSDKYDEYSDRYVATYASVSEGDYLKDYKDYAETSFFPVKHFGSEIFILNSSAILRDVKSDDNLTVVGKEFDHFEIRLFKFDTRKCVLSEPRVIKSINSLEVQNAYSPGVLSALEKTANDIPQDIFKDFVFYQEGDEVLLYGLDKFIIYINMSEDPNISHVEYHAVYHNLGEGHCTYRPLLTEGDFRSWNIVNKNPKTTYMLHRGGYLVFVGGASNTLADYLALDIIALIPAPRYTQRNINANDTDALMNGGEIAALPNPMHKYSKIKVVDDGIIMATDADGVSSFTFNPEMDTLPKLLLDSDEDNDKISRAWPIKPVYSKAGVTEALPEIKFIASDGSDVLTACYSSAYRYLGGMYTFEDDAGLIYNYESSDKRVSLNVHQHGRYGFIVDDKKIAMMDFYNTLLPKTIKIVHEFVDKEITNSQICVNDDDATLYVIGGLKNGHPYLKIRAFKFTDLIHAYESDTHVHNFKVASLPCEVSNNLCPATINSLNNELIVFGERRWDNDGNVYSPLTAQRYELTPKMFKDYLNIQKIRKNDAGITNRYNPFVWAFTLPIDGTLKEFIVLFGGTEAKAGLTTTRAEIFDCSRHIWKSLPDMSDRLTAAQFADNHIIWGKRRVLETERVGLLNKIITLNCVDYENLEFEWSAREYPTGYNYPENAKVVFVDETEYYIIPVTPTNGTVDTEPIYHVSATNVKKIEDIVQGKLIGAYVSDGELVVEIMLTTEIKTYKYSSEDKLWNEIAKRDVDENVEYNSFVNHNRSFIADASISDVKEFKKGLNLALDDYIGNKQFAYSPETRNYYVYDNDVGKVVRLYENMPVENVDAGVGAYAAPLDKPEVSIIADDNAYAYQQFAHDDSEFHIFDKCVTGGNVASIIYSTKEENDEKLSYFLAKTIITEEDEKESAECWHTAIDFSSIASVENTDVLSAGFITENSVFTYHSNGVILVWNLTKHPLGIDEAVVSEEIDLTKYLAFDANDLPNCLRLPDAFFIYNTEIHKAYIFKYDTVFPVVLPNCEKIYTAIGHLYFYDANHNVGVMEYVPETNSFKDPVYVNIVEKTDDLDKLVMYNGDYYKPSTGIVYRLFGEDIEEKVILYKYAGNRYLKFIDALSDSVIDEYTSCTPLEDESEEMSAAFDNYKNLKRIVINHTLCVFDENGKLYVVGDNKVTENDMSSGKLTKSPHIFEASSSYDKFYAECNGALYEIEIDLNADKRVVSKAVFTDLDIRGIIGVSKFPNDIKLIINKFGRMYVVNYDMASTKFDNVRAADCLPTDVEWFECIGREVITDGVTDYFYDETANTITVC